MSQKADLLGGLTQAISDGFERIRTGSLRVARLGRLNLDLLAARGRLRRAWNELGALAAKRWIDDGETAIDRSDPAIASLLARVRTARQDIERIEEACRAMRAAGAAAPPPGGAEAGSSPPPPPPPPSGSAPGAAEGGAGP